MEAVLNSFLCSMKELKLEHFNLGFSLQLSMAAPDLFVLFFKQAQNKPRPLG